MSLRLSVRFIVPSCGSFALGLAFAPPGPCVLVPRTRRYYASLRRLRLRLAASLRSVRDTNALHARSLRAAGVEIDGAAWPGSALGLRACLALERRSSPRFLSRLAAARRLLRPREAAAHLALTARRFPPSPLDTGSALPTHGFRGSITRLAWHAVYASQTPSTSLVSFPSAKASPGAHRGPS
jgi:hypothetical protein